MSASIWTPLADGDEYVLKSDLESDDAESTAVGFKEEEAALGDAILQDIRDAVRFLTLTPEGFGAVGVELGATATDQTIPLTKFFNAINANPGIQARLPKLLYGISSELPRIKVSGVKVRGSGSQSLHDVGLASSQTTIKWIGGSGGTMQQMYPDVGATAQRLDGIEFIGITYDCASVAAKGFVCKSVRNSEISVVGLNGTTTTLEFGSLATASLGESADLQDNVIDAVARNVDGAGANGTAIRITGTVDANVSLNIFRRVLVQHSAVPGIVHENSDNNVWLDCRVFHVGGAASNSIVWQGSNASLAETARGETYVKLSTVLAAIAKGTSSYTYPATTITILALDTDNGTPIPTRETGASVFTLTGQGIFDYFAANKWAVGDSVANAAAARGLISSTSGIIIVNGGEDHLRFYNSAISGGWAARMRGTNFALERLVGSGYYQLSGAAIPDYADDTAAAAGGVPLNGIYRTTSTLKIRMV